MFLRDYLPALKYGAKITSADVVGIGSFDGLFKTNVWYVDGTNGLDSNTGDFDNPFKTIQKAITTSGSQDTIYVRTLAPDTDASDPGQYAENLTIPYAKHGLKIIGVSSSGTKMPYAGPKIKNASAGALLTVLASGVHLENLQFNCTRNSGTYGIYLDGEAGYAAKAGSVGFTIVNCMIKNGGQTGAYYGIEVIGGYGGVISNCTFQGCLYGLNLDAHLLPGNGHIVENCNFKDVNGAAATAHINIPAGSEHDFDISGCSFGAATKFIVIGASGVTGNISFCTFMDGSTTTAANSTGKIEIPAANDVVGVVGCYGGGDALIAQNGA